MEMKGINKHEAEEAEVWIPVYSSGKAVDRLVADSASEPVRFADGMQFTDSFGIHPAVTENEYRAPLSIEATVMTDSTNIVLMYGKGLIILNWDRHDDLLHVRHPVTGQIFHVPGSGGVPVSRWHHVEWIISEDVMRLLVNGDERYAVYGNFRGLNGPVSIRTGWRANLRIGSLTITEYQPAGECLAGNRGKLPESIKPETAERSELRKYDASGGTVMRGFHPVPHKSSLLGCCFGAMRYYNRYLEEVDWLGTTGLAFRNTVEEAADAAPENMDMLMFASKAKLLGFEIVPWNKENGTAASFIRNALTQGVLVFGRFKIAEGYRAVTLIRNGAFMTEGTEGSVRMLKRDDIAEPNLLLFTIGITGEADRRDRLVEAFRYTVQAAADNRELYTAWSSAWLEKNAWSSRNAEAVAGWRKSRESAVQFLELSSDFTGPDDGGLLLQAIACYRESAAALGTAESYMLNAGNNQAEAGLPQNVSAVAAAIAEAAGNELKGAGLLDRLANHLSSKKLLRGLRFNGMSCMSPFNTYRGITDYYGIRCSDAWLRGVTGRPLLFAVHERINVHDFCVPLPEQRMIQLFGNIGLEIGGVEGFAQGDLYRGLLKKAWDTARASIDSGLACFGRAVNFSGGEYSLINGYDDDGYYTSSWHGQSDLVIPWTMYGLGLCTCEPCTVRRLHGNDEGPVRTICRCDDCRRLHRLGDLSGPQEEGEVRLYWAKPKAAADDRTVVREALGLAVQFAQPDGCWARPEMHTASAAYDIIIRALEKGLYDGWYLGLHANSWRELRLYGWKFLIEAKERTADPELDSTFDEAISYAGRLKDAFVQLNEMFPWMQPFGPIPDVERRYAAAALLRKAKEAESGLQEAFKKLLALLEK